MHKPDRGPKAAMTDWVPSSLGGSYRYFTGSLSYVLHRVSGLALIFFLFAHILSITKAGHDPLRYDLLYFRFQEADFKLGEILLYGALLFHGLNGIRLLLVDFVFENTHSAKKIFWAFFCLIIALLIIGSIPLIFHWNTQALNADLIPGGTP